jgi:thiol:disulfide interchange protein DsbC
MPSTPRSAPSLTLLLLAPILAVVPTAFAAPAPAAAAAPLAAAAAPAVAAAPSAEVRAAIAKKIPGTKAEDIKATPVPGVYEVAHGADIAYVTGDGQYAFAGDLYQVGTDTNLTETRRRDVRNAMLAGVPDSQMVVFSPKDPKYTITVFTDIDCGYCRKLHSQIAKYNELGIRVRYMFYPRTGPNTESWAKAVAVWCAPDRNDALTRGKRGEALNLGAKCGANPVAHDYELGQELGVRGTPAIFLANGDMLPGYVEPAALAKRLQSVGR